MVPTMSRWPPVGGTAMVVAIEVRLGGTQEPSAWEGGVKCAHLLFRRCLVALFEGGMQRPQDKGRWVYGFDHNGDRGGGKGAEEQVSLALLASAGRRTPQRACCLCLGMVLRDVCGLPTRTLSPSVQRTRTSTE